MNKLLIVIGLLFLSCNSLKVNAVNQSNVADRAINHIFYIGLNEKKNHNGKYICEIVLKQNNIHLTDGDIDWHKIKEEINRKAIVKGGNILEIDKIGYNLNGFGFYLRGKLYYNQDFSYSENVSKCDFVLFRDGLESGIASKFAIDVSINNERYGMIKEGKPIHTKSKNCNEILVVKCNDDEYEINIDGETRYFKVSTREEYDESILIETSSEIIAGATNIDEIQYPELGRLMWIQNSK